MVAKVQNFIDTCKQKNIRITPQRLEIYKHLIKMEGHPSVEKIYQQIRKKLPNVSMDTIYRTLNSFEKMGVLSRVKSFHDVSRFETNLDDHHHFYCQKCHRLSDFAWKEFQQIKKPNHLAELGQVASTQITVYGICKECANTSNN